MHLSHLTEDLEAWYLNFDFAERVLTAFRPGMTQVRDGTQTVAQGPPAVSSVPELKRQFAKTGRFGHSASIQAASRLLRDTDRRRRNRLPEGNRDPAARRLQHARQPVRLDGRPEARPLERYAGRGVHFVVFNPSSDDFERNRLAMDGVLPDGTKLPVPPGTRAQGFNSIITTTHRQNFLVPPRRHRSFPLAELVHRRFGPLDNRPTWTSQLKQADRNGILVPCWAGGLFRRQTDLGRNKEEGDCVESSRCRSSGLQSLQSPVATGYSATAHSATKGVSPLPSSSCGPVVYKGSGTPDFIIPSDLPLQGAIRHQTVEISRAMIWALAEAGWKAGPLQDRVPVV